MVLNVLIDSHKESWCINAGLLTYLLTYLLNYLFIYFRKYDKVLNMRQKAIMESFWIF